MLDSLLTLTKRGAFWLITLFFVALLIDIGVSAMIGMPEVMFLLLAIACLGALVVSGVYTLAKRLFGFGAQPADKSAPPRQ